MVCRLPSLVIVHRLNINLRCYIILRFPRNPSANKLSVHKYCLKNSSDLKRTSENKIKKK